MTATLFASGRVLWCGELGPTKTDKPMRGCLVATSQERDDTHPPVVVRQFGEEAQHVQTGDLLAAEGELEASIRERDGKPGVNLSIMARWCRLTGHAGQRQRKSQAAQRMNGQQQDHRQQRAFDDELPGHMQDDPA
jgi:hypothetical protein